jgi:hypothetical protein
MPLVRVPAEFPDRVAVTAPKAARILCCSGDRDHLTGPTTASRASGGSLGTAVPAAKVRTGQGRRAHGGAT